MLAKRTFWGCMKKRCDVLSILMLQVGQSGNHTLDAS